MLHTEFSDGSVSELYLKTVPPRPPHRALARLHLGLDAPILAGAQVVLVEAGAGWGKSALLAQWRRTAIDAGHVAAWLSVDGGDEPCRLAQALWLALQRACGIAARPAAVVSDALDAATGWLAFAARLSREVVLLIDEVERLPPDGADLLRYILHNMPPNLRIALSGRSGARPLAAGLDGADAWVLGPALLRLTVAEVCQLAGAAGAADASADDAARLHEATEGWPLGVQLALRARARTRAPGQADHRHVVAGMLEALAQDDLDFLLQLAICDTLHPDLCGAVTGMADSARRLARLVAATPLFSEAEAGGWLRLHTLARDALRERLADWPAARTLPLHLRASDWFERHGMLHEAARHAHAAGALERAYGLAERALLDLVRQGRLEALAVWRDVLPEAELRHRPRLRLAIAWSLALTERPERALALAAALAADAAAAGDALLRYEAALVACAAQVYADQPDRFEALFAPWAERPPAGADRWLRQAHANRSAALALLHGHPGQARWHLGAPDAHGYGGYGGRWGELLYGCTYLWQGQAQMALDALRAPAAAADAALGRRHPLAAMFAAALAAALHACGEPHAAQVLLANRLDTLARSATPDTLLLGYLTAARLAADQGLEHRALDLCDTLLAAGERRALPRVCMAALGEQIRIHAARGRADTCGRLYLRLLAWFEAGPHGPLWQRQAELLRLLAEAQVALAASDWNGALALLERAAPLADALQLGRSALDIMGWRAQALNGRDGSGARLAHEAAGLAHTFGARAMTHPPAPVPASGIAALPRPLAATDAGAALLTPKEREVLELLARKLSNKEIAHILAVGEETVKWHLKNLFSKLEAGSRRHAVSRAVTLGLLE